jgi:hypothetical protein
MLPLPIQFLVATIAAAINGRMARQLEYAQEEVRTLKEALTTTPDSPVGRRNSVRPPRTPATICLPPLIALALMAVFGGIAHAADAPDVTP